MGSGPPSSPRRPGPRRSHRCQRSLPGGGRRAARGRASAPPAAAPQSSSLVLTAFLTGAMVGLERRPSQPVGGREKQGVGAGRRRGAAAGAGGGDPGAAAARGARRPPRGCALHPPLAHLAAPASCAGVWPPARPPPRSLPLAATLPSRPPPWCACGGAGDRAIAAPPRAGRRKCRAAGLGAAAPRGGRDRGDRGPHRRLPFLPPPPHRRPRCSSRKRPKRWPLPTRPRARRRWGDGDGGGRRPRGRARPRGAPRPQRRAGGTGRGPPPGARARSGRERGRARTAAARRRAAARNPQRRGPRPPPRNSRDSPSPPPPPPPTR